MFATLNRSAAARARLRAVEQSQAMITFALDGTILDANERFLALMGYGLAEVRGRPHRLFVDPEEADSPDYTAFWDALRRGETRTAAFRRVAKDGREVWIRATYCPVPDRHGRPVEIVKYAFDVTAERLARAEATSQIRAISRSQAVIQFDLDGMVLDANENLLSALGYALDEVRGRHHRIFVPAGHAESAAYAEFWDGLKRGEVRDGEFKRQGKDGREVWIRATYNPVFDMNGRLVKIVKFALDVTAAKRADAERAGQIAAIERSQAVIQFGLDGTILDANENFLSALGYALDEVRGRHHRIFVPAGYAESAAYAEFWDGLRVGRFASAIYQRLGKNGREVWIQATYSPILDPDGRPYKVVKYATDITNSMSVRNEVVRLAGAALENVHAVSSAAEAMHATSAAIVGQMVQSRQAVEEIQARADSAEALTLRLREAALAMDGVVQTISGIAEQINLLALNATIEAARAGSAGRGFAVVASEVKNLASQAQSATTRISGEIAAMQAVSSEVGDTLSQIGAAVVTVGGFVTQTAEATEAQRHTTGTVSANMQTTASGVAGIARCLDEWVIGLDERREKPRERVFMAASIDVAGRIVACTIVDRSAGGARLRLAEAGLPDRFVLTPPDGAPLSCSVVRRQGDEISVRFD
ncbi:MAG: PAS domain S-box protein [Methylobacterium frigidaeris]